MGNKPLKDIDSVARSQLLRIASWTVLPIGFLGYLVGGYMYKSPKFGLFIGVLSGLLVSAIIYYIIEYISSLGGNFLYGRRKPIYSDFEKHEGPLNQARHLKVKNEYAKAHNIVNDVLTKAPDLPEALYLKAQILWEGYRDADSSKICLEKIMVVSPDKKGTYHRWALSLHDDIENNQDMNL